MATRSRIGIQFEDKTVLSCYHHWDGYPEWLGRILKTHYNDRSKALILIAGGDMSSCWTTSRWDDSADGTYGPEYYSQRGESCPPRKDANVTEYLTNGEQYSYLYTLDDEWVCYNSDQNLVSIPNESLCN